MLINEIKACKHRDKIPSIVQFLLPFLLIEER